MATSAPKAAPKSGPKAVPSPEAGDTAASPNRFRIILLVILGVVLLAGAGGAWYFFGYAGNGEQGAAKQEAPKPPVFMTMEMFTVNLQSEDIQQFLQVAMTVQVANEAQTDLIKLHMPQVRNRLLLLLSSKKPSEILSVEGKKKLTAEIIAQLKQPFTPKGPGPEVVDVFFTSFVVQ
ncbi:MAG: flagellar basal body-associated protein FliL [Noviherbaspirillum sp.]